MPDVKDAKSYRWDADGQQHELRLVWVPGTGDEPCLFGRGPSQLGLYDMSGNVWEWCEDVCTDDLDAVPADGRPYLGAGVERRLRGGCHHNWDLHCRVFWRYGIDADAHDGCIGLRVVLASTAAA